MRNNTKHLQIPKFFSFNLFIWIYNCIILREIKICPNSVLFSFSDLQLSRSLSTVYRTPTRHSQLRSRTIYSVICVANEEHCYFHVALELSEQTGCGPLTNKILYAHLLYFKHELTFFCMNCQSNKSRPKFNFRAWQILCLLVIDINALVSIT